VEGKRRKIMETTLLLCALFFIGATLYSSVGHAGASAYLAAMALVGVAPAEMKPIALVLNICVASLGVWRYSRAGFSDWKMLWPFLIGSVPLAFIGGSLEISDKIYKIILGIILLIGAARLLMPGDIKPVAKLTPPGKPVSAGIGAGIGFLAGLTGTGGGIFLSPVLIFTNWASVRVASGIASGFILANSIAGLAGQLLKHKNPIAALPPEIPVYAAIVLLGGWIGTTLGTGKLATRNVLRALGVVLIVAGGKLVLG
jgi:uncharacterized protein